MLLYALTACDDCAEVGAGWLEVGTGESQFESLADGDTVTYTSGGQGGQHIWGSLRAGGILQGDALFFDAQNPVVNFEVLHDSTVIAGYTDYKRHFDVVDDTFELIGETLVLDTYELGALDGETLTLRATLLDKCGTELADSKAVVFDAGDWTDSYY